MLLLGLWLAGLGTMAQTTAPATAAVPPATAVGVHTYTLANGMTLWVKPDRRAPTAVHMLWVRVGSIDEVDGTSGVAHVLEHMMFKGTEQLGVGEFSRRVAALGGRENAFTSKDYTGYYQQIPSAHLEEVMRLEADRFANNRWPDEEFAREIEVVREERRLRTDDNPRAQLGEMLMATVFSASPQRRPIVGWMSDLQAMRPDDVREFHRRWYVPANALVVVAGDVDPEQVRQWAERHYGRIPARALPVRKQSQEPLQQGLRRIEWKATASQAYVAMAYKVPGLRDFTDTPEHRDALALTMLAAVLDGTSASRLDRRLTQGPGRVADSAGASYGLSGRGPQLFWLDGVPAAGQSPQGVEQALRAELRRVAEEGVTEQELTRVKTQWRASQIYDRDSVFNQARELGSAWIVGWQPGDNDRLLDWLDQVTPAQVQSVAQRYFGDEQLTVGTLLPQAPQPGAARAAPRAAPAGMRH
ncbi:MAG: Protease 3 precursor [Pseudomonadota bacterium]|jgi:zinc protease